MIELIKNKSLLKAESFINGQWVSSDKRFPVYNPFSGEEIIQVYDMGRKETTEAIEAAHTAFGLWSNYSAGKRSRILKNWYRLQLENLNDLAVILTMEQGKPISEAKGEIGYGASFVEWFAEEAKRAYGDIIPGHSSNKRITVLKQPVGVVGAITPWNFPSAMITRKIAPALAAGCTVVIKPSEQTPLSALALAQLAGEAGFPSGVINIVVGSNPSEIGIALTSNKLVRKISFTGSTAVGKILLKQSADTVKKVTLELGGNAPFIVFDDADVDAAVKGAMASKYRNTGQTCICSNRFFAQEGIYDEFVSKLAERVETDLVLGNGIESETNVGPLIEKKALEKVIGLVENAKENGARVLVGGEIHNADSLMYAPTVLADVKPDMRLFSEEIFGPVAPVFKFSTVDEVIQLANNTDYGLASYFYGKDYSKIWKVAEALEFGMVGVNTGLISTAVAPFGGIKQSGFGVEGSKYGMDDYLNLKYICWEL